MTKKPSKRRKAKAGADDDRGDAKLGADSRVKRLLDLVVVLLNATSPVPFRALREQFEAYRGKDETALRTFERDKAELLEHGIPLRFVQREADAFEDDESAGYVIDRRAYLLPPVKFTRDEIAALVAGAAITRAHPGLPYADAAYSALGKITFDTPAEAEAARHASSEMLVHLPAAEQSPVEAKILSVVEEAARLCKRVHLTHRAAADGERRERDVDPFGLVYRQGAWLLVGHCHLRGGLRTFRLDRVESAVMAPRPRSPDFERPALDLRAVASRLPWRFDVHPPVDVVLEMSDGSHAIPADELDELGATRRPLPDGRIEVAFACTNTPYLRDRVRVSAGALRLIAPAEQVAELVGELEWILSDQPLPAVATGDAPEPVKRWGGARDLKIEDLRKRGVRDRFQRLLYIVPRALRDAAKGGAPLGELAGELGVTVGDLVDDLGMLAQVGPPNGDPGEFIAVSVQHGRAHVHLPQRLTRPQRLTVAEAFALLLGTRALGELGTGGGDDLDALTRAEQKIRALLGAALPGCEGLFDHLVLLTQGPRGSSLPTTWVSQLRAAIRERVAITMSYLGPAARSATERGLDPYGLLHHAGAWYVVGRCHLRDEIRVFRLDRITALSLASASFSVPAGFDLESYRRDRLFFGRRDALTAEIALDPAGAARVSSSFSADMLAPAAGGGAILKLSGSDPGWLARFVLGLGRHSRVLGPVAVAKRLHEEARGVLERHVTGR